MRFMALSASAKVWKGNHARMISGVHAREYLRPASG
jgi:hypothetical protein